MSQSWVNWSEKRPTNPDLVYRWRLAEPRIILKKKLQPEWSNRIHSVGMGYADKELWPGCSSWNGHTRTVPKDLEWRIADEDVGNG